MPCLVDGDEVITESRTIAQWIEVRHPQPPLAAAGGLEAAEAAAEPVFGAFARYCKCATDGGEEDTERRKELLRTLCALDAHLAAAAKPYVAGEALSVADCFLLPAMLHVRVAGARFKGFEIPPQFDALQAYMNVCEPLLNRSAPPDPMVAWGWANARGDAAAATAAAAELVELPN